MKTSKRLMQMVRMMGKPAPPGKPGESRPLLSISETLAKVQPTVWVVLYGYLMAALVSYLAHRFFLWCPPYLQEIVKN
ncbi:MAG TPA: hypothetical protein VFR02_03855, partial [bacterium]|nr:hypothetical protein [bacterium]